MAAETPTIVGSNFIAENGQNLRLLKSLMIYTPNTADAADTVTVDLANYGGTTLLGISSCKETTDGSVFVTEANTCSVTSTTVTITIAAGTDNDPRNIQLFFI